MVLKRYETRRAAVMSAWEAATKGGQNAGRGSGRPPQDDEDDHDLLGEEDEGWNERADDDSLVRNTQKPKELGKGKKQR